MLYTVEQGPIERKIVEQCMRERLPLPDRIAQAPELQLGLELFYGAYVDLSTCRSGLGDGPISWLAIAEYASASELDEEQTEDLHYYVPQMDNAYLKWRREKDGRH